MSIYSWLSFILVVLGSIVMSINIKIHFNTYRNLKLIPKIKVKNLTIEFKVHLIFMCFFFITYVLIAIDIVVTPIGVSLIFLSFVLFLGSLFVFIGISIQGKMLKLISETYLQTIKALTSAIEARDKYTMGHSEHVANLSVLICKNIAKHCDINMIEYAALLHDIGKIGISEEILNKPGKLSEYEFEIIKKHPKIGNEILNNISGLDEISKWILYHHERIDGKGYYGINKNDIPIESKIISIADMFSSLVTTRPYRKGIEYCKAIEIMEECAGSQLDEEILEIFFNIPVSELEKCMPSTM